jgi:hypothetical protein
LLPEHLKNGSFVGFSVRHSITMLRSRIFLHRPQMRPANLRHQIMCLISDASEKPVMSAETRKVLDQIRQVVPTRDAIRETFGTGAKTLEAAGRS